LLYRGKTTTCLLPPHVSTVDLRTLGNARFNVPFEHSKVCVSSCNGVLSCDYSRCL
jgi:hypothetical protein